MFRQSAVDRLSSPEELDRLTHVTSPRSWLILVILFLCLLAGGLWLAFTSIPTTVSAQGALAMSGKNSGHIEAVVYVNPEKGAEIAPGMQVKVQVRRNGAQVTLPGTVHTVSDFAVTEKEMASVVGNEAFARSLATAGNVLPVHVDLTSKDTSGLTPGQLASATITLAKQRGLNLVVP